MDKLQTSNISKRPVFIGLIVFVALLALTQFLSYQRYVINSTAEHREIINVANAAKERMQNALQSSFTATKTLAFIVEKYGAPKDFNSVAKPLLEANKHIDAIQLVKAGVITNVYPLKGNEAAIGYDILKDTARKSEAVKAIQARQLYFSGPFELKQGGMAVVGRQPIFIKNKFWGFAAVIIKLPTLLHAAGIDSTGNNDFIFQLSKINPHTKQEEFFLPNPELFSKENFVSVQVPDGDWNLYVQHRNGRTMPLSVMFIVLGFALSLLGGLFAWYFIRQPEELNKQVKEKTQQLTASETNYRTTLGRVSDAFVALDKNWRYTFLNDAALANHPLGREETLGKVIWDVHPEMEGTIFQQKYYEAMETGKATEAESYYPPFDTWFSVKVYPSADGLTIFYKDITESKKAEQQIIREKTLSDSLINSLPGLFYLYDETGKFLRWNKNFETISGYSGEEISKMHPLDFFPDDEKQLLTQKIQSVFSGGNDDVEANFYTKDRKKIPYYFNGWATEYEGKKCLLGVAIDITEHKKAENDLKMSIERFNISAKATNDIIWDWDLKTNAIWWNENFYSTFNYRHEDVPLVIDFWDERLHPEDMQRVSNKIRESIANRENFWTDEYRFLDSAGNTFYIYDRAYISYDNNNEPYRMVGAMINITGRKIAEEKIIKTSRLYYVISRINQMIVHATNEETLFNEACRIAVEQGKFSMAWVGVLNQKTKHVIPVMHAGEEREYLSKIKTISIDENIPEGQGPTGTALREGRYSICNDIEHDPHMDTWREEALNRGYRSSISLPIKKFGKLVGAFSLYASVINFFDAEEIALLVETTNNISFALENFDKEKMRKQATEEVVKSRQELRELSVHLQSIREEERTHIAREIHDELGQQLTGLKMDIAWIKNKSEKEFQFPLLREKTNDMIDLVNNAITSVRKIAKQLRPGILDDLGLEAAIEWQANEFAERTGIKFTVDSKLDGQNFSKDINTAVFRIFQESLTNIARHSQATQVAVKLLISDNKLTLQIIDNGIGISDDRKTNHISFGLLGMHERAAHLNGTFSVEKYPEGGTIVILQIPLPAI
jgi:PAS domain S-box-containing protein